jgi:hypothetical protein
MHRKPIKKEQGPRNVMGVRERIIYIVLNLITMDNKFILIFS